MSELVVFLAGSDDDLSEKVEEQPNEDGKPVREESIESSGSNSNAKETVNVRNQTKPSEDKAENQTEKIVEKKATVTLIKDKIEAIEIKQGPQVLLGEKFKESYEK